MNVIITADWHIGKHLRYNPSPNYRLNQSIDLAKRINELAHEYKAEVWILGDIIDKAVSDPDVTAVLKDTLDALVDGNINVKYILGNHDAMNRSSKLNEKNSLLYLMDDYLEYMDRKSVIYDNHKFTFSNYQRKIDMSWLEHTDVFLTHMSIGFGQVPDVNKFDLMFYGDIHNTTQVLDKCISVGSPYQLRVTDESSNSVILLNTAALEWRRIKLDNDKFRSLKLSYSTEKSGYDPDLNTWHILKKTKIQNTSIKESIQSSEIEFDKLLIQKVKDEDLERIHNYAISQCSDYNPVDFNFNLLDIRIHNIKGIKDFYYEFKDSVIVQGPNGSGKSSFILSVYQMTGDMKWSRLLRKGHNECYIIYRIKYQGKLFELKRSNKDQYLKIDGTDIKYKDRRDFESVVLKNLPFLRYSYAYIFNYWNTELFGSMNPGVKLNILSRFNGLDIFKHLNKFTEARIEELNYSLKSHQREVDRVKSKYELLESQLDKLNKENLDKYTSRGLGELKDRLDLVTEWMSNKKLLDEITDKRAELDENFNLEVNKARLSFLKGGIDYYSELLSKEDSLRSKGKLKLKEVESLKHKYEYLLNHPNLCPTCGQEVNPKEYQGNLKSAEIEYSQKLAEYKVLESEFLKFREDKPSIQNQLDSRKSEYDKLNSYYIKQEYLHNTYNNPESKAIFEQLKLKVGVLSFSEDYKTKLTEEFFEYSRNYNKLLSKKELESQLNSIKEELESSRSKRDRIKDELSDYKRYYEIINLKGPVYNSILNSVVKSMSNEQFKYSVTSDNDISVKYFYQLDNGWKSYEDCSSGQKTQCDLHFLKSVLHNVGLVIFDESFRFIDRFSTDEVASLINEIDSNLIILSTHDPNLPLDYSILQFPINY